MEQCHQGPWGLHYFNAFISQSLIDCPLLLQESGLKVREYELLRRNFSETGNFGKTPFAAHPQLESCRCSPIAFACFRIIKPIEVHMPCGLNSENLLGTRTCVFKPHNPCLASSSSLELDSRHIANLKQHPHCCCVEVDALAIDQTANRASALNLIETMSCDRHMQLGLNVLLF